MIRQRLAEIWRPRRIDPAILEADLRDAWTRIRTLEAERDNARAEVDRLTEEAGGPALPTTVAGLQRRVMELEAQLAAGPQTVSGVTMSDVLRERARVAHLDELVHTLTMASIDTDKAWAEHVCT